ncbi:MAG: SDR family oxidoreductase [Deltaproteobacteria bacterium]|nr:SDR family oxidoreductase [Deltaproteobacteria bacterium]
MDDHLKALVLGGSGSLGAEVCRVLAKHNVDIVFTYHHGKENADRLVKALSSQGIFIESLSLDLHDMTNVREVVQASHEKLGGIDSLIIASGIATGHFSDGMPVVPDFFDITPEMYDDMMSVNVRGIFFTLQEVARIMTVSQKGRIVIVGSIDGIKLLPSPVDYACCKAALWGMCQSLAKELGKYNILVNMVAPGILEGGIAELLSAELMQEYLKHCSLKRVGTFSEIANMIVFLAGPKNTYLTGHAIVLDGGL